MTSQPCPIRCSEQNERFCSFIHPFFASNEACLTFKTESSASLFCATLNSFLISHCSFFFQIPHSLFKEEGYDHREALFGMPPYGGSIAQNVYYADADLCDPNVDTSRGYPTRDTENGKMKPWPAPYILMVDRGGCTFVKKVRNKQAGFVLPCRNV